MDNLAAKDAFYFADNLFGEVGDLGDIPSFFSWTRGLLSELTYL